MDAEDQLLARAVQPLVQHLKSYVAGGRPLNRQTMRDVDEIVAFHTRRIRQTQHVNVPPLSAIILHSIGHVALVRSDMDDAGLHIILGNLLEQFKEITIFEVVQSIQAAFPCYRAGQRKTV